MLDLMGSASFRQTCERCGHEWTVTRVDDQGKPILPKKCPKCNSPYWRKPRLSKTERAQVIRKRTQAYWRGRKEK